MLSDALLRLWYIYLAGYSHTCTDLQEPSAATAMSHSQLDTQIAALEKHIGSLEQSLAEKKERKVIKLKEQHLQAEQRKQQQLHRLHRLQQARDLHDDLQRQRLHRDARAGFDSARAQQARGDRAAAEVTLMRHHNAEKVAMIKECNHQKRYIAVMEEDKMIEQPDWEGDRNWQHYQQVKQLTYKLCSGKLSKPATAHIRIRLSQQLFAMGGFRYVYYAQTDSGQRYVAKRLYGESDDLDSNLKDVEADIKDHLISEKCIADFHRQANKAHASTAPMHFTDLASLIIVKSRDSAPACGKVVYFLEPLIEGQYCKWIQNSGDINTDPHISGADIPDTTQAMVHFSYEMSLRKGREHRYMITDIQGFKLTDGTITLIDPAICRPRVAGVRPNGADYGLKSAANAFFKSHKCSHICRALKLPQHAS